MLVFGSRKEGNLAQGAVLRKGALAALAERVDSSAITDVVLNLNTSGRWLVDAQVCVRTSSIWLPCRWLQILSIGKLHWQRNMGRIATLWTYVHWHRRGRLVRMQSCGAVQSVYPAVYRKRNLI